jgi:hypothetical protein
LIVNEHTLEYLRQHLSNPYFVCLGQLEPASIAALPSHWHSALALSGGARVRAVLEQWGRFERELPEVVARLRSSLDSVELVAHDGGSSLIYNMVGNGRSMIYASDNPTVRAPRPTVAGLWSALPASVRVFYEFADGWFFLASRSLGPAAAVDMFVLDEEEWGILDDLPERPQLDLSRAVALFTNGAFGYVCADTSRADVESGGVVWWSDKAPRIGEHLWGIIDAWTALGLNG